MKRRAVDSLRASHRAEGWTSSAPASFCRVGRLGHEALATLDEPVRLTQLVAAARIQKMSFGGPRRAGVFLLLACQFLRRSVSLDGRRKLNRHMRQSGALGLIGRREKILNPQQE